MFNNNKKSRKSKSKDKADKRSANAHLVTPNQVLKGEKIDGAFGTGKTLNSGISTAKKQEEEIMNCLFLMIFEYQDQRTTSLSILPTTEQRLVK